MNIQESATGSRSGGEPGESPGQQALPALETVEVCTGPEPSAAVIWLHGLGADGHDFEPFVPALIWPGAPDVRFVFPHAPMRPVTINGGMRMRAWYDILSLNSERGHDERGVVDSVNQAAALVRREMERGIPSERIVLAGFSQGGAIALQLAMRYPHKLCGLIVLSTYLLFGDRLESQRHAANLDIPVFAGHGSHDPMVPVSMGEAMSRQLQLLDYAVEWHSYPIQHAVCPEEATHIAAWLKERFA